jgi:hypothetical protein
MSRLCFIVLFGTIIFLGAFLLFQVQPLIGRFLLPWFGGTPDVWTACMLFFQLFLLLGYGWAHLNTRLFSPRQQAVHQIALLILAGVTLSIVPPESLKPAADTIPLLHILLICSVCVGLPYFLLSTTGPMLQVWFARIFPGMIPYRFYALSNAGSLLALISFPLLFEPRMTRFAIAQGWMIAFWVYAVLYAVVAIASIRKPATAVDARHDDATASSSRIPLGRWLLWVALPACASIELLAVTTTVTQDIAVIPFLWIVPLCLYLLSFILCFDHPRWYVRPVFVTLFMLGIAGVIYARYASQSLNVGYLIGLYMAMLFFCAMVCHGELYRLRPESSHLTAYYLAIAAGGALGGILVAVVAPLIFNVHHELHLGLLATVGVLLAVQQGGSQAYRVRRYLWTAALLIVGTLGILFQGHKTVKGQTAVENTRNFFGTLTVWEEAANDPENHTLLLQHGTTFHGLQFQWPEKKLIPTAYYSRSSGVGLLLDNMPKQEHRTIGVVGLGVGTIAIYGKPTDTVRFYEINPEVERLARKYFTYLSASPAKVDVALGDARLVLESEPPQHYDVLIIDAFSSDAVPIHLVTREAFAIYLKHLADGGVLAFHISTMHLDLNAVVWKLAEHYGLEKMWIENDDITGLGALGSDWILLSKDSAAMAIPALQQKARTPKTDLSHIDLWTDDAMNLLQILK